MNIALYTSILPAIATFAFSGLTAATKDLLLAKASIICLSIGAFVVFISATPAVMIIGKRHDFNLGTIRPIMTDYSLKESSFLHLDLVSGRRSVA